MIKKIEINLWMINLKQDSHFLLNKSLKKIKFKNEVINKVKISVIKF